LNRVSYEDRQHIHLSADKQYTMIPGTKGMNVLRKSLVLALVIPLLLSTCLLATSCAEDKTVEMETVYRESPPIIGAARKSAYLRPDGSAPFPVTAPLVVLRGTWRGMGEEYGKRSAAEIRQVFEGLFQRLEEAGVDQRTLSETVDGYRSLLEGSSPEMLEFMEGIAEGSSLEIQKSASGPDLDATQKIILINFFSSLYESAPGFNGALEEEGSCWECRGTLTATENPLAGANVDASFYPFMYRLALVVIPDDPESSIYFSLPVAGSVGGPIGLNAEGVYVAAFPVNTANPTNASTEGAQSLTLSPSLLSTLVLTKSRDVKSARETLLYGPQELGAETGEGALIRCTSADFLITDGKDALVLERGPLNYSFRGEETALNGGTFIAATDHFTGSESYDAKGEALGQPMSAYGLSGQDILGSTIRLRSLQELFRKCDVKIDTTWLIANAACMNYIYDKEGNKSYQVDSASGQVVSCFESGLTVDRYVPRGYSPYFGTVTSVIVAPSSLDIWYELGLPSDWVGPWEYINLGDYQR
jgi:hypothetical protein